MKFLRACVFAVVLAISLTSSPKGEAQSVSQWGESVTMTLNGVTVVDYYTTHTYGPQISSLWGMMTTVLIEYQWAINGAYYGKPMWTSAYQRTFTSAWYGTRHHKWSAYLGGFLKWSKPNPLCDGVYTRVHIDSTLYGPNLFSANDTWAQPGLHYEPVP